MKIKSWLLLSYLAVLLLPSVAAYLLVVWINSFYQEQKVEEYFQHWTTLQDVIHLLEDPQLYQVDGREKVEGLAAQGLSIVLYNREGLILYTSDPLSPYPYTAPSRETLYKDLYVFKQGYRAYTYKQPVFNDGQLVGFFEVQIGRKEWLSGVNRRTIVVAVLLILLFSFTYLVVVLLVQRKLNRRLKYLMGQMSAFAQNRPVESLPLGNDEIGELAQRFYDMKEQIEATRQRLQEEQKARQLMIAAISHDLKTPLTSIGAYAEALANEKELSQEERKEYRNIIIQKANYMREMLDDLLMYALLNSPEYRMERVVVDGGEFFDMLLSDYEPLCEEKGIRLATYCAVTHRYRLNPQQMMRVMDNLVTNALAHTPPGGQIGLAAIDNGATLPGWVFPFVQEHLNKKQGEGVYLLVQNEGEGIPKEKWPLLFQPLYQGDEARSKKGERRTGLGLSITRQIIEKHDGQVKILSEERMGTCVICYIPQDEE